MILLLDVNALVALAHVEHAMHLRAGNWVRGIGRRDRLATCAITEIGFVRVAVQAELSPTVDAARKLLMGIKRSRRPRFTFLSDAVPIEALPDWATSANQTTDAHLVALAEAHGGRLVTFDRGIPGAIVLSPA